jgi:hypothetical protein
MTEHKAWWKSRTILAGLAVVLIEVFGYLGEAGVFEGLGFSAATAAAARNWTRLLSIILGILIVQFRRETSAAITGTNAAKRLDPPGGA